MLILHNCYSGNCLKGHREGSIREKGALLLSEGKKGALLLSEGTEGALLEGARERALLKRTLGSLDMD